MPTSAEVTRADRRRVSWFLGILGVLGVVSVLWWGLALASDVEDADGTESDPTTVRGTSSERERSTSSDEETTESTRLELGGDTRESAGRADLPTLVVHVTHADAGTPIVDIPVRILRIDGGRPEMQGERTDSSGIATFVGLDAGEVHIQPGGANVGERNVTVRPVGITEFSLRLAPCFSVRGIVQDVEGRPIAGAELFTTDHPESMRHADLRARTGADGRFAWTSWQGMPLIFAVAKGYSTSPVYDLLASRTLRIAMRRSEVDVLGRVLDERGAPIVGASVVLRGPTPPAVDPLFERGFFGSSGRRSPEQFATTVDGGGFRIVDLPTGAAILEARCEGYGQRRIEVELTPGPVDVTINLGPPFELFGKVTDTKGEPVAGAVVGAGMMFYFHRVQTRSASDGSYRLAALPDVYRRVVVHRPGFDPVSHDIDAGAESPHRFDPVLRRIRVFDGVLLDEDGTPLSAWFVQATGNGLGAETDARGRFQVRWESDDPPALIGWPKGRALRIPQRMRRDAVDPPQGRPPVYRPDPRHLPTAHLSARLRFPDGTKSTRVSVMLRSHQPPWRRHVQVESANPTFEFGPLPSGTYSLEVTSDALPRLPLGTHELRAFQSLDLGTVAIQPAVPLRVDLQGVAGELEAVLRDSKRVRHSAFFSGGMLQIAPLAPGRYSLTLSGSKVQWHREEFELVARESRSLKIRLKPGIAVQFGVMLPETIAQPDRVRIDIEDESGRAVADLEPWFRLLAGGTVACGLASGSYRATATAGPLRATVAFQVHAAIPAPVKVVFELR